MGWLVYASTIYHGLSWFISGVWNCLDVFVGVGIILSRKATMKLSDLSVHGFPKTWDKPWSRGYSFITFINVELYYILSNYLQHVQSDMARWLGDIRWHSWSYLNVAIPDFSQWPHNTSCSLFIFVLRALFNATTWDAEFSQRTSVALRLSFPADRSSSPLIPGVAAEKNLSASSGILQHPGNPPPKRDQCRPETWRQLPIQKYN